jgi:hypothetical protein
VFENRVLRRIFEPRREKVEGEWRRLHNEELHNLHSSPNIIKVRKTLVGKPEGKTPLRRSRRRWEDNIRMDLSEVGREIVDWIYI